MGSCEYIQQFFFLLIFYNFIANVSLEWINSGSWFKSDFNIVLFSWIYDYIIIGYDSNELFFQLF